MLTRAHIRKAKVKNPMGLRRLAKYLGLNPNRESNGLTALDVIHALKLRSPGRSYYG